MKTARRSFGTPEKRLGGALLAIPDEPTPEKVSRGLSALAVTRVELGEPMASVLELRMLAAAARASRDETDVTRAMRGVPGPSMAEVRSGEHSCDGDWSLVRALHRLLLSHLAALGLGRSSRSRCRNSHAVRWGGTSGASARAGPPLRWRQRRSSRDASGGANATRRPSWASDEAHLRSAHRSRFARRCRVNVDIR